MSYHVLYVILYEEYSLTIYVRLVLKAGLHKQKQALGIIVAMLCLKKTQTKAKRMSFCLWVKEDNMEYPFFKVSVR